MVFHQRDYVCFRFRFHVVPLAETKGGDDVLRGFEIPDINDLSSIEDAQHHWTSEALQHGQDLQSISFRWRDQGWGNRKGQLFLDLLSPKGDLKASKDLVPDAAEHHWTRVVLEVDEEDPIQQQARPRDKYSLRYKVGGGGGHELHVLRFNLHFGGEL